MRNRAVSISSTGSLVLILVLSGCTGISDCKYELGQKIRTSRAWNEFDGCNRECFTCDYRAGWKAGYYDVVTGGSGCPPVVAPKKYWEPPVFAEHDPSRRDQWYRGFQDGAAHARCEPDYHYLQTFLPGYAACPMPIEYGTTAYPVAPVFTDPNGTPTPSAAENDAVSHPGEIVPAPTENAPKATEKVPAGKNYEKDPESSGTKRTVPAEAVSQADDLQPGNPGTGVQMSLTEQLVLNASLNSTFSNETTAGH